MGPLLPVPSFGDLIRLQNAPNHGSRIVRPRDLVQLHVLAYLCQLQPAEGGPHLVPTDPAARLEVRFPFQHLAERAWFKVDWPPRGVQPHIPPEAPGSEPSTAPPTEAPAARGIRLVFDIPGDEAILFSAAGVIAALSRLPLRVHKLATARRRAVARLRGTAGPHRISRFGSNDDQRR